MEKIEQVQFVRVSSRCSIAMVTTLAIVSDCTGRSARMLAASQSFLEIVNLVRTWK